MEAPKPSTINPEEFFNEKIYYSKINDYNLSLSSNTESIKFSLKSEYNNCFSYEGIYTLEKLTKINKIFLSFDSIDMIRNSIEDIISNNKFSVKENKESIELILKVPLFQKIIDIPLKLNIKNLDQKEINGNIYEQLNNLNNEIKLLKEENKELKKSNEKILKLYDELKNNMDNMSKGVNSLKNEDSSEAFKFRFREGKNYKLNDNGRIATKTSGGDRWNCTILGNKEIPKNKISKWKIKINNFEIKSNTWNILIGIGPYNFNNYEPFYEKSWSFICGRSMLSIQSGGTTEYNNHSGKLKQGDIVEVIADRKTGNLSFSVNDINYGITNISIPKEDSLFPVVMINDQNQKVEIV